MKLNKHTYSEHDPYWRFRLKGGLYNHIFHHVKLPEHEQYEYDNALENMRHMTDYSRTTRDVFQTAHNPDFVKLP